MQDEFTFYHLPSGVVLHAALHPEGGTIAIASERLGPPTTGCMLEILVQRTDLVVLRQEDRLASLEVDPGTPTDLGRFYSFELIAGEDDFEPDPSRAWFLQKYDAGKSIILSCLWTVNGPDGLYLRGEAQRGRVYLSRGNAYCPTFYRFPGFTSLLNSIYPIDERVWLPGWAESHRCHQRTKRVRHMGPEVYSTAR